MADATATLLFLSPECYWLHAVRVAAAEPTSCSRRSFECAGHAPFENRKHVRRKARKLREEAAAFESAPLQAMQHPDPPQQAVQHPHSPAADAGPAAGAPAAGGVAPTAAAADSTLGGTPAGAAALRESQQGGPAASPALETPPGWLDSQLDRSELAKRQRWS